MAEPEAQQIEVLVREALNRAGGDRASFLAEACQGDVLLRSKINQLLAETEATASRASPESAPPLPDRIGRYNIKREIASGGMGTVYEAVQEQPRRTVALKVMRRGVASRSALRRFEYESQILARLRHPHIAQVHEAGTHDDGSGGVPFFAMEYIPNAKTLTEYVTDRNLGTRHCLGLFVKVCDAVHHGHQKGIIHRDLKPSNILVDTDGQPKIIDFGVARATDSDMALTTLQTDAGQLIGTLQYMSPEQCAADPHDLDSRSDIYALGIVLYELLCGELPYDVSGVSVVEAARLIREQAPTRLSGINRTLRGDLETIVLKALEKERAQRYQSSVELAADIDRYLTDQPIVARRPSAIYQLRKFARRNRLLVGGLATLIVVLVAATVISTYFWRDAAAAARRSYAAVLFSLGQQQEHRTEALAYLLASLERADNLETRLAILEKLWEGPTEFRFGPAFSYNSIAFSPDGHWLAVENGVLDKRTGGWLWPSDGGRPTKLEGTEEGMEVRFSAKGDVVVQAVGTDRRRIGIWSIPKGRLLNELPLEGGTFFDLSRDGNRVFTCTETVEGENALMTIQSWPVGGEEPVLLGRVRGANFGVASAIDPMGTLFAWGAGRNAFVVPLRGDPDSVAPWGPLVHKRDVNGIAFDPSGEVLATGDGTETKLWSVTADQPKLLNTIRLPGGYGVRFDGSGSLLASNALVANLNFPPDAEPLWFPGGKGGNMAVAFHPDGDWLATGNPADSTASLWPLSRRYPIVFGPYPDQRSIYGLAFAHDGSWVASAGPNSIRIWPIHLMSGERSKVLNPPEEMGVFPTRVVADPNGRFVVAPYYGPVLVLPLDGGPARKLEGFSDDTIWALAISPDGRLVAAGSGNYKPKEHAVIRIWDLETGVTRILDAADGKRIEALEFTPDGDHLLASSIGTLRRWNLESGTHEVFDSIELTEGVHFTGPRFDLSPDGHRLLAVCGKEIGGELTLFDLDSSGHVATSRVLTTHTSQVLTAIFDNRGEIVISTDIDGALRVGPVSGEEPHLLLGLSGYVGALAVTRDNEWIATGGQGSGSIVLWPMPDVDSTPLHLLPHGELVATLKSLTNLRVVPDETSASGWKLETGPFPGWNYTPPTW